MKRQNPDRHKPARDRHAIPLAEALPPVSPLVARRGAGGRRSPNFPDLNLMQISRAIGISNSYLGRILSGAQTPSLPVAHRLAAYMGWSIEQVLELKSLAEGDRSTNAQSQNRTETRNRTVRTDERKSFERESDELAKRIVDNDKRNRAIAAAAADSETDIDGSDS